MKNKRFLAIILGFSLISAGAAAQSKLTNDEWMKFKRSAGQYDSLQIVFQKMVDSDPELQKNPSLLNQRISGDMAAINEIYQGVTANAGPAIASLGSDFSDYTTDDLQLIKMAAIATKKVENAVKVNDRLLEIVENTDSSRFLKMEQAKYHTYLKNYDEAAAFATADVLSTASDQDKLQFYPTIAKGYAVEGNMDKSMLYAFKAMETYEQYRKATAEQLKGTGEETKELEMMNRYFQQQYVDLLFNITMEMKDNAKLKESFLTESSKFVEDEAQWGAIKTQMQLKFNEKQAEAEKYNKPAPAWATHDWMKGEDLDLGKLKGKVVLVDFFATWCRPCIMAFPHIRDWQEKYSDEGLVIAGLTTYQSRYKGKEVTPEQEAEKMKNDFMKENDITWHIGIENGGSKTFERYAVQGIPHVVLIDKEGKLRYQKVGASGYDETEEMIKKLLAE